jgi:hypothetical protein
LRAFATWTIEPFHFATDTEIAAPVVVCSHERSGTHFLINSLAKNSAYRNNPYLDYDSKPLGSFHNFHHGADAASFFQKLHDKNCASIVKSHFAAPFFRDSDGKLVTGPCKIVYIVRNPFDVMLSYHGLVQHFPWHEGPKPTRVLNFVTAAPEGRMLRYQWQQADTLITRWKAHVTGWYDMAAEYPANILFVRYQDLDCRHADEMKRILTFLGCEAPAQVERPDRFLRTIQVPPTPRPSVEECRLILRAIAEKAAEDATIRQLFPELFAGAPSQALAG